METVNIHEARAWLSQLVDFAAAGKDMVIGRHGKPLTRITRLHGRKQRVRIGVLNGKVTIAKDCDAPLPDNSIASIMLAAVAAQR